MDILYGVLLVELGVIGAMLTPVYTGAFLARRGEYDRALPWFRRAYSMSRILRSWRGMMAGNICACYTHMGDFLTALPYAEEAVRETGKRSQRDHEAVARMYFGVLHIWTGDYERAQTELSGVLASLSPRSALRHTVQLYQAIGFVHQGKLDEGMRLLRQILTEEKLPVDTRIVAECGLSVCHYYQGNAEAAWQMTRSATKHTTKSVWTKTLADIDGLLYLTELKRLEEAKEMEARLMPKLTGLPPYLQGSLLRASGRLALALDDLDRARMFAEQGYGLDPNPNSQAASLILQAEVFAARKNAHRTRTLCEEALRLTPIDFYRHQAEALLLRVENNFSPVPSLAPSLTSSPAPVVPDLNVVAETDPVEVQVLYRE